MATNKKSPSYDPLAVALSNNSQALRNAASTGTTPAFDVIGRPSNPAAAYAAIKAGPNKSTPGVKAPKPVAAPPPPPTPSNPTPVLGTPMPPVLPAPTPTDIFASQGTDQSAAQPTQSDLSGVLAALQGAQGAVQAPPSIMDQLTSLLGPSPELPTMDINKLAQQQVDLQYGGQDTALKQAMQQLANQTSQQQNVQQLYGQKADKSLGDIYAALQGDLTQGRDRTAGYYDQATNETTNSYDQANQALAALNQGITGQLGDEASQLGISQGLGGKNNPLARILSNYQGQQGANIGAKANSLASLQGNKANSQSFAESQIGNAGNQGAQARADIASQVQAALANIGLQSGQQQGGLLSQEVQLGKDKGNALAQAIANLTSTQYNQQRQAQQDRLAQITGLGGLDQKNQEIGLTAQGQQVDLQKALAQIMATQSNEQANRNQAFQISQQKYTNPLELAKTAASINQSNSSADLAQGRLQELQNPTVKPTDKTTYQQVLDQFTHSPQEGLWGATGAGPKFTDALNALIQNAQQQQNLVGVDPFNYAESHIPGTQAVSQYGLNQQGLMDALRLYFKGK